jgi:hypothetical protein
MHLPERVARTVGGVADTGKVDEGLQRVTHV